MSDYHFSSYLLILFKSPSEKSYYIPQTCPQNEFMSYLNIIAGFIAIATSKVRLSFLSAIDVERITETRLEKLSDYTAGRSTRYSGEYIDKTNTMLT